MHRNQRKYVNNPKRNGLVEKPNENRYNDNIEEVLPPKGRRNNVVSDKNKTNRCCHVSPDYKDVEQSTEFSGVDDQFRHLVLEQYDIDPTIPDQIRQLKELRKVLCGGISKVENWSQCDKPIRPSYIETADRFQWQSVDNTDEIEECLIAEKDYHSKIDKEKNIYISEEPKVKVIVEKFSKVKRDNVEVRKLEEKIVCVEYEVFEEHDTNKNAREPIQKMRAYFSIKPITDSDNDNPITDLPSTVKRNFNLSDKDFDKLDEKEIEIINDEIADNKSYLEDLKKVLLRNQENDEKKKSCLDLMALYIMAKENIADYKTNLLTDAGLREIKKLVKKQSANSKHGINRRTIRNENNKTINERNISQSIFNLI